jgi:hypothetical protein
VVVQHPTVVPKVGLRRTSQSQNRRGETAGNDGSESELLHFDTFFCVSAFAGSVLFRTGTVEGTGRSGE